MKVFIVIVIDDDMEQAICEVYDNQINTDEELVDRWIKAMQIMYPEATYIKREVVL